MGTHKNKSHHRLTPAALFARFAIRRRKKRLPIFGEDIEKVMQYDMHKNESIPLVCRHIIEYLSQETRRVPSKYGLYKQGLFRQCGSQKMIDSLIQRYETGNIKNDYNPFLEEKINTHVAGSLFKQYLRHLPEPLIPEMYETMLIQHFMEQEEAESEAEQLEQDIITRKLMKRIFNFLPDINQKLLNLTCYMLTWTDTLNELMKAPQLSRVFCQVIMDKGRVGVADLQCKVAITNFVIKYYMDIFDSRMRRQEIKEYFPERFITPQQRQFIDSPGPLLPTSNCRMSISSNRASFVSSPVILDHAIEVFTAPVAAGPTKRHEKPAIRRCTPQTPNHVFFHEWYMYAEAM